MEDGDKSKEKTPVLNKDGSVRKKPGRRPGQPPIFSKNRKYPTAKELWGPTVREQMIQKYGLTADLWAQTMRDELSATKLKVFMDKDGNIVESREYIDWKTRQNARESLGMFLRMNPDPKLDVNLSMSNVLTEKLNKALERANGSDRKKSDK